MTQTEKEVYELLHSNHQPWFEEERVKGDYSMWTLILFNLRVMSSFLADYSPTAFYLTVTLMLSSVFASIFRVYTY